MPPVPDGRDHPPLSCGDCKLGSLTPYGVTITSSPDSVYLRRREVRTIPAGRTFLREGEAPQSIFTLYSGWAMRYKQLQDGHRQILSFIVPGDLLVLENLCFPRLPLPFSVKSLTAVSMCAFLVEDMIQIMHGTSEQNEAHAWEQQRYVASMHERLLDIGRRSALGRIAHLLLELRERLERRNLVHDGRFVFPVRQEHLGDALGLTTVYVNRTLVALRKRGIIDFDRASMTILEPKELTRIAQDE